MTTAHSGMFAWLSVFPPISKKQITELNPKYLERFKLLKLCLKISTNSWSPSEKLLKTDYINQEALS